MVRTVRRTLLHSQLACNVMQASARTCGRRAADSMVENIGKMLSQVKSIYFNHPSQVNSTNYYFIMGPRDKAAPPTSQQINKFPSKRVKNPATPSSIFIFISSSSTGELCSQPFRGNVHRIGRMFPEHVERSILDPDYSFVAVRRILPTRFAKKSSPNLEPTRFAEYFQLGSRTNIRPIKNGLNEFSSVTTQPPCLSIH